MRVTEELVNRIVISSRVTSRSRRCEIERELQAHIEDFSAAQRLLGRSEREIEQLVLTHFGDPEEIARDFAWVYRYERRMLRTLAFVLSTVLIAASLFGAILTTQMGLAFGFGTPIASVIASRHTMIEGFDILSSAAAYLGLVLLEPLFAAARFPKASALLVLIAAPAMILCNMAGLHPGLLAFGVVNGIFTRALRLFVNGTIARVGVVVICFPLAGLILALQWSSPSHIAIAPTCASWWVAGAGYQLMAHFAARTDHKLLSCLQRIAGAESRTI